MKFIWEVDDIQPGVRYGRKDIAEVWIIGYLAVEEDPNKRYTSISLEDGMVCKCETRDTWAEYLNRGNYVPIKFMEGLR